MLFSLYATNICPSCELGKWYFWECVTMIMSCVSFIGVVLFMSSGFNNKQDA